MLSDIHSLNDTTKTSNSDQLQQTEQRQDRDSLSCYGKSDVIKWYGGHKVDYESTFHVGPEDNFLVEHFITTKWIIKCCLELYININTENEIND